MVVALKQCATPGVLWSKDVRLMLCYTAPRVELLRGCTMRDTKLLDELHAKLSEMLAGTPARDLERNLKAVLNAFFARVDLVTREEFDVQRQVLLRTRERLERLEARVAELDAQRAGSSQERA